MSNTKLEIPAEFNSAPKEQKIAFVQDLWNQIAQESGNVPVPESHNRILHERLQAFRSKPQEGRPWNEVRDQLLEKIRST
jgi:putative addiction module component (TIGR02574 family)